MALVVQTMGIVEVRVLAAEGVGALVHHTHKISNGPCNIFRDHIRRVIAGADHHAVQKILQRDLLADLEPHDAAVLIETRERRLVDGNDVREVAVFQRQQARHDFGQTRRIHALVCVLLIDGPPGVEVDEQRRLCRNRKAGIGGDDDLLGRFLLCRILRIAGSIGRCISGSGCRRVFCGRLRCGKKRQRQAGEC